MMKKIMGSHFKILGTVWLWPGQNSWHFITLDKALSVLILKNGIKGMIPIEAKVGKTTWQTSLFPHKLSRGYILCLKKEVRTKEEIYEGDQIKIDIKLL